jgi:hypothetical protein
MIRGIYEKPLVLALKKHYDDKGYLTRPHAQLNIAWSTIISDVDLIAMNDHEIIAIEVKTKKDVFRRAFIQLDKIAPFVDKCYIATDDEVKANEFSKSKSEYGILYVDLVYDQIIQKKPARRCTNIPTIEMMCYLRRCCLQEIARHFSVARDQPKQYLALDIQRISKNGRLRQLLKDIVVREKYSHTHNFGAG